MPGRQRSRPTSPGAGRASFSSRARLNLILLLAGLTGSLLTAFSMTSSSAGGRMAESLGMNRLASNFDKVLAILAWPILLFCLILCAYSFTELIKIYRAINDPESYGGRRRHGRE